MAQITLQDVSGASPSTSITLTIAEDEEGNPRWTESRLSPIPPAVLNSPIQWNLTDPRIDLHWTQDDWSGGAFETWIGAEPSSRYAVSDGVDLRWKGVAALGPARDTPATGSGLPIPVIIRDAGAESSAPTSNGWTQDDNTTLTATTGAKNQGDYGFVMTSTGINTNAWQFYQELANPTAYRSVTIDVTVYVKKVTGGSGALVVRIDDGVGQTNSADVTGHSSYTKVTVSRAIDASATKVRIGIYCTSGDTPATHVLHADDWSIAVNGITDYACKGMAEQGGELYAAWGPFLCEWNETNEIWDAVYVSTVVFTDVAHFDNNVYGARGYSTAYIYGTDTSWTVSTLTGDDKYAGFLAVTPNSAGARALWKSETANSVAASTNPVNGGSAFSTPINVGSSDHPITKLYGAFGTLVVGKEDGLFEYQRFAPGSSASTFDNTFVDVTGEQDLSSSPNNYSRGVFWGGWLWMATQSAFVRYRPGQLVIYQSLLRSPRSVASMGRVRAITADDEQVWVILDDTAADTAASRSPYLIAIRDLDGQPTVHSIQQFTTDVGNGFVPDFMGTFYNNADPHVWALGRTYDTTSSIYTAQAVRWHLPLFGGAPYDEASPDLETSGYFETAFWHGGLPDTLKAFLELTIICEDLGASDTIAVSFGLDGAPANTTSLGTFNGTGRVQTLSFDSITTPATNAVGRLIRLRFTFTAAAATQSPKLYAFGLHTALRPEKVKQWEFYVRLEDEPELDTGYKNPVDLPTLIANLDTLEDQTYPIRMVEDLDGDGTETTTAVYIRELVRVPSAEPGFELYRLVLQQAHP